MAPPEKLSDADVRRLRRLADDGWTATALADEFGVTAQHVGRLLRGEQRAALVAADGEVGAAVAEFCSDVRLDAGGDVLAATARALAGKVDACAASDASAAAQAMPRLAAQLVVVLAELREGQRAPDELDDLRARRDDRLRGLLDGTHHPGVPRSGAHVAASPRYFSRAPGRGVDPL